MKVFLSIFTLANDTQQIFATMTWTLREISHQLKAPFQSQNAIHAHTNRSGQIILSMTKSAVLRTRLKAQREIVPFGRSLVALLAMASKKILITTCQLMFIEDVRALSSRKSSSADPLLLTRKGLFEINFYLYSRNVTEEVERSRISVCKVTCTDADDCNTFRYPDWVEPPGNECPPGLCEQQTSTTTSSTQSTILSSSTEILTESTSSGSTESSTESSTVSSTDSTMSSSSSESTTTDTNTTSSTTEEDKDETDVGLILGATALALTVTAIGGAGVFFFCNRKSSKTNPDKI